MMQVLDSTAVPDKPVLADAKIYDVLYKHRFPELDGLRGIAAVMVSIGHALSVVMTIPAGAFGGIIISLAVGYINGGVAVDLFFIMSGFFLSGMIENQRSRALSRRLSEFYIRRFVRLVPPAVAAVCVFIAASKISVLLRPSNAAFAFQYMSYYPDIHYSPLKEILLNLILIRHTINPPLWTIRLELFTSVLFPLVVFLKNWRPSAAYRLSLLAALILLGAVISSQQKLGIDVFHYLYIFYCGALIRDFGPLVRRFRPYQQYIIFYTAIIGLLVIGHTIPLNGWHPFQFDLPVTFFGALLVAVLSHGDIACVRRWMNSRAIQFLGRISYSFYLMNWLSVMLIGSFVVNSQIPERYGVFAAVLVLAGSSLACNILLGSLLHVAVEKPAVGLSRYLANRSTASQ